MAGIVKLKQPEAPGSMVRGTGAFRGAFPKDPACLASEVQEDEPGADGKEGAWKAEQETGVEQAQGMQGS